MALDTDTLASYTKMLREMMLDEIEVKLIELGYLAPDSMDIKRSIYDVCSRYLATFIINDSYYIHIDVTYNVFKSTWIGRVYVAESNEHFPFGDEPDEIIELTDIKEIR